MAIIYVKFLASTQSATIQVNYSKLSNLYEIFFASTQTTTIHVNFFKCLKWQQFVLNVLKDVQVIQSRKWNAATPMAITY